ncbi:MAG: UDP-N-acetylmuramoyl-L-alanine--D-glutamate ligase [Actinobacteria bacterium]|nr:UDP-N-acetylmuramoyl-L-alanine--D-glutamate ligase [Actinomycetota bacterium]
MVVETGRRSSLPYGVSRVLVLGAGRSGLAAARALVGRGYAVTLSDSGPVELSADLDVGSDAGASMVTRLGPQGEELLVDVDLVIKSPGIPGDVPIVWTARRRGIPVWSEIELGYRMLRNRISAVTGTNGKTTTTSLVGHMFAMAGLPVQVVGNIGTAMTNLVDAIEPEAEVVVEVSSFQLEDIHQFRPVVAILLNLTQDHLDRHGTMEHYAEIKARVFENQQTGDVAVLSADDPLVASVGRKLARRDTAPEIIWFSTAGLHDTVSRLEGERLVLMGEPSLRLTELNLKGLHNVENCLAAASAVLSQGIDKAAVEEALRTFPGVEHRLQWAGTVRGVQYVNDSKATNVEAALKALSAYPRDVHLILGGRDKASDYAPLAQACLGTCRSVYLIGEAAPLIRSAFETLAEQVDREGLPELRDSGDLERAVHEAAAAALEGDTVLLAPACASFDQYRNFEERGHHFVRLVAELSQAAER